MTNVVSILEILYFHIVQTNKKSQITLYDFSEKCVLPEKIPVFATCSITLSVLIMKVFTTSIQLLFSLLLLAATGCDDENKQALDTMPEPTSSTVTAIHDTMLVDITTVIPDIVLDIRYATANNFTGQVLYPRAAAYLRKKVADKLAEVQTELKKQGLGLKIYDGYRSHSIQKKLWEIVPDERYVADPAKGSRHNRGAAVDLTIIDSTGQEIMMPTGYDDFTEKAHRDYMELPQEAIKNRAFLEELMAKHGFSGLPTEWWHFDADGWEQYPILDLRLDELP